MAATCPHCNAQLTISCEHVTASRLEDPNLLVLYCAQCNAVLNIQPDPVSVADRLLAQITDMVKDQMQAPRP